MYSLFPKVNVFYTSNFGKLFSGYLNQISYEVCRVHVVSIHLHLPIYQTLLSKGT